MARAKLPVFTDFVGIPKKNRLLVKANLRRGAWDHLGMYTLFFIVPAFLAAFLSSIIRMPLVWLVLAVVSAFFLMKWLRTSIFGILIASIDTKKREVYFPIEQFHVPFGEIKKMETKSIPLGDSRKTIVYGITLHYKKGHDIPGFFFTTVTMAEKLIYLLQEEQKRL